MTEPNNPPLTKEQKYDRVLLLNRERQRKWYDLHKRKVSIHRQEQRQLFNRLRAEAGLNPQRNHHEPIPTNDDDDYDYDEPQHIIEPEIEPIPEPIPVPKFSTLTEAQLKKIKTVPTKSKQTLAGLIKHLETNTTKGSIPTYKTSIQQLYEITNTEKHKPINLNNPELLFKQLDDFKYKGKEYGIDKKTNIIQSLVKIADPTKGFKLDVSKSAFEKYQQKFDLFKISKRDHQLSKKEGQVFLYKDILAKALTVLGKDSKFYLYLRLYVKY